jgi:hypothetical protein
VDERLLLLLVVGGLFRHARLGRHVVLLKQKLKRLQTKFQFTAKFNGDT